MQEKGVSDKQLADTLGVSKQYINKAKRKEPTIKLAKRLGEILNVHWTKFYE